MRPTRRYLKPLLSTLFLLNLPVPPGHGVQLFRTPASPEPLLQDKAKNCVELEREIAALTPMTYSYKPDFYQNPYQGASILLGTTISPAFYVYPVYDYYLNYRESRRIIPAEDRLEQLRYLKASKRCFEN